MGRIYLPESVERDRTVNAVRSTLSPDKRYWLDRSGYRRDHQASLFNEAESKKQAALKERDGRDRRNKAAQLGNPLACHVIMARLMKLNPSLMFELAKADSSLMGIYIRNEAILPEKRQYLFCFSSGISPEFTTVTKTAQDGEVEKIQQGWRTVLARLIKLRLITAHGSFVLFGPPSRGSKNWQEQTT